MLISSSSGSTKPRAQLLLRTTSAKPLDLGNRLLLTGVTACSGVGQEAWLSSLVCQECQPMKIALPLISFSVYLKVWLPQLIS